MRPRALLLVVTLATALIAAGWPVLAGQAGNQPSATAADDARRRVDSFSVVDMPRIDALMTLARQHRVPLGIEYAGPELFTPVTVQLDDTSVGTAINALFPASLGFRVALDGIVPVIRHAALLPASRSALDVVLPRLVVPRTTSMQRAGWLVWMTLARQLDPTIGGFAGSELGTPPEERIPPTVLTRVSARAALSRLARADGRGVWFVTVPPAGLDRRWTKENPPMWSATQYDYGAADFVGRQIAARMPDIVPRDGPGSATSRPRVGVTTFSPRKIKHVDPIYPSVTAARTEQTVVLELRIDQEGRVESARILRSVPPFDQAALDAVRQWQYEPLLLNGLPTPFIVSVLVNFTPSSDRSLNPIARPVR